MEKKKSNKGLVFWIVFLIILLLGSGAFIYYGYMKYSGINNDYKELSIAYRDINKKLSDSEDESSIVLDSKYLEYFGDQDIKIYGIYTFNMVFGYSDGLYSIDTSNLDFKSFASCISDVKTAKFKDNAYYCKAEEDDEDTSSDDLDDNNEIKVTKLDVKVSDIYKVVINNCVATTDPQYDIFVINKDGSVKKFGTLDAGSLDVFKDYKLKDIKEYCSKKLDTGCEQGFKLTLQDGTVKDVKGLS